MRAGMLAILVATAASAWAEAPAPQAKPPARAAGWDDSHMQSRYQETPRTKRPLITGESGYGALASGGAEASKQVSEEIEFTSQRQWVQGPIGSTSPAGAKASDSEARSSGAGRISRGSQLRAGAVSSGRRGR